MINIQLLSLVKKFISEENKTYIDIASFGHPTTFLPTSHQLTKGLSICEGRNTNDLRMQKTFREKANGCADIYSFESLVKNMNCSINKLDIYDIDPCEIPFLCWDLNMLLPRKYHNKYDLAIDSGTHEHVFNIGTSLINFASLPKLQGYVVGALPYFSPNHGFYNVNPNCIGELFSVANGYKLVSIIINGYQSPIHSLLGETENSSIIYNTNIHKETQSNIWSKIQRSKPAKLSKFNTMYYVAKRIKLLDIMAPIQYKYKA